MDRKQIENLLNNCSLPDSCQRAELKETHISWIILTDHYAFKNQTSGGLFVSRFYIAREAEVFLQGGTAAQQATGSGYVSGSYLNHPEYARTDRRSARGGD